MGVGGVVGALCKAPSGGSSCSLLVAGAFAVFAVGYHGPDGDGIAVFAESSGTSVPSSEYLTVGASIEFGDGM